MPIQRLNLIKDPNDCAGPVAFPYVRIAEADPRATGEVDGRIRVRSAASIEALAVVTQFEIRCATDSLSTIGPHFRSEFPFARILTGVVPG
jgi:hypothetical protein